MGENSDIPQTGQPARIESIDDPIQIIALCQRIVSERLFVTVTLADSTERYDSTILGVDTENGVFYLDSLYPESGNELLRRQRWLRLRANFDKTGLTFTSQVEGEGEKAGIRYFRVRLPERVDYAQRRANFRVSVGSSPEIPVVLHDSRGSLQGRLHDISVSGLSVRLSRADADRVEPGQMIESCVVEVPDESPIVAAVEIRDVRTEQNRIIVGGRFIQVDRLAEQRIERFVAETERQWLKKRRYPDS